MDIRNAKVEFAVLNNKDEYDNIFNEIYNIPPDLPPEEITARIQQKITLSLIWIHMMSKEALEGFSVHRVRVQQGEIIDEKNIAEFYYPPDHSKIKLGRANISGQQVFYTSADSNTPFYEMEGQIEIGKSIVYISRWAMHNCPKTVNIHSLFLGIQSNEENDDASIMAAELNEQAKKHFAQFPEKGRDLYSYCQQCYTDLFTFKGEERYHLSSAIAYYTFVSALKQKADIPIIAYPSVAKAKRSVNFAIRQDFADKYLYLKQVDKVIVTELGKDAIKCRPISRGFVKEGKVEWREFKVKIIKIHYEEAWIYMDKTYRRLDAGEGLICATHKISIEEFIKRNPLDKDTLIRDITKTPEQLMISDFSISEKGFFIVKTQEDTFAENEIVHNEKIKYIRVLVTYDIGYELT